MATHYGRPKTTNDYSTNKFIPILEKALGVNIHFLPKGLDSTDNADIIAFADAYTITTSVVNNMLAYYVDESGGDMEATAMHYLENHSEWESWVPADVAAKVKSTL